MRSLRKQGGAILEKTPKGEWTLWHCSLAPDRFSMKGWAENLRLRYPKSSFYVVDWTEERAP